VYGQEKWNVGANLVNDGNPRVSDLKGFLAAMCHRAARDPAQCYDDKPKSLVAHQEFSQTLVGSENRSPTCRGIFNDPPASGRRDVPYNWPLQGPATCQASFWIAHGPSDA